MPADLPEVAQQEWKRITALLAERGDLSALDRAGLADYCLCFARLVEIEQYIGGHGLLVPGLRGLVKNPALQLARQYRASLQRWADQFGLTPVSRGRLSLPEPDGNDDDLLD